MVHPLGPHANAWARAEARAGPHSGHLEAGWHSWSPDQIPDKSDEFGFAPCGGLLPDAGSDSDDEAYDAIAMDSPRASGGFQDWQRSPPGSHASRLASRELPVGKQPAHIREVDGIKHAAASSSPSGAHAHVKLDLLHQLFQHGVAKGMHGGPEMLQYALEAVSSDTSLDLGACEEAFLSLIEDRRRAQKEHEAGGRTTAQRDESSAEGEDERFSHQALQERTTGRHHPQAGPRHIGFSSHASI